MSIPKGTLFDTHKVRFNVVRAALKEIECTQTDSDNTARIIWWDGYMQRDQLLNMYPHQRINRIPGMDQICFKSNTFMAMNKLRNMNRDLFNFFPLTFILPNEYDQFKKEADKALAKSEESKADKPTWIFKPRNGQCGIGIQLFQDPSTVADTQKYNGIVQSYIAPHLVDGIKFDLRLYLFVSTINPYTIYLYHEGLSRFCTEPYVKPNSENLNDLYMHLTNTSVNIKNQNAPKSSYIQFATPVLNKLNKPDLWNKIKRVAALSMVAQYHQIIENIEQEELILLDSNEHFKAALKSNSKKNSEEEEENSDIVDLPPVTKLHRYFHLAGIDILINDKYEPILLEMNDRPSMFVSFEEIERELKKNLVKEALSLISLDGSPVEKNTHGKWEKIFPDPEDHDFNKKAHELMQKSLKKPISNVNAVKIVQQPQNTRESKPKKPPQITPSQMPKKCLPNEKAEPSQQNKKSIQNETTVHQFSKTLHSIDTSSISQYPKKSELNSTMQLPKKVGRAEQISKDIKLKKAFQQEKKEEISPSSKRSSVIEKTDHPYINSTDNQIRARSKKPRPHNPSPERSIARQSAKPLKMSSSTYIDEKTIRRSNDRLDISSDSSPTSKKVKKATYTSSPKQIASSSKRKTLNTNTSSNDTLPPLSSNKESPQNDAIKERTTLSNLPGINQYNCQ